LATSLAPLDLFKKISSCRQRYPRAAGSHAIENPKRRFCMITKVLRRGAPLLVIASLAAASFYFWGPGKATPALSFGGYQMSIPNGDYLFGNMSNFAGSNNCLLCHGWNASTPGSILGSSTAGYLTAALKPFSGSAAWGGHTASALVDTDGDGFTNGEELQDPSGAWTPGSGTTNFGDQAFVSNPNWNQKYPAAPIISSLSGLASNQTISGKVAVNATLRYAGLSRVVYTFSNASVTRDFTVAAPAVTNYAAAYCLGYASAQAGACTSWDSTVLPDGVYAVTVTVYDKLAASLGGPQKATYQLTGVTIHNVVAVPPTATSVPPTATLVPPTATSVPPTATPVVLPTNTPVVPPTATPIVPPTNTPVVPPTSTPIVPPTDTPIVPPTVAPPPTGGPVTYVVQRGDTLFRIAKRFGTSVRAIQLANGIRGTWIRVGQTLVIPGANPGPQPTPVPTEIHRDDDDHHQPAPTEVHSSDDQPKVSSPESHSSDESDAKPKTYTVKAGDNLFRIGLRFGVSVGAIQAANGLRSVYIQVGQVLTIP
jgi:LysM repeat protein